jgi:hypothetical protein
MVKAKAAGAASASPSEDEELTSLLPGKKNKNSFVAAENNDEKRKATMGWRTAGASLSLILLVFSGAAMVGFLISLSAPTDFDADRNDASGRAVPGVSYKIKK